MEDLNESTRCGKFGYEVINDQVIIPYIFRGNCKWSATKIFTWHFDHENFDLSSNLCDFSYLKGCDMNSEESCLFNEINRWHNDSMYPFSFKKNDLLMPVDGICEIFKYAYDCTEKSKLGDKYKMAGGIVLIKYGHSRGDIMPYIQKDGKKFIPVQLACGLKSLPQTVSTTTLKNIDVMYLRYVLEVSKMADLKTGLLKSQMQKYEVPCVQLDEFIAFLSKEDSRYTSYDDNYWISEADKLKILNDNQNFFNNNNQKNNDSTEKTKIRTKRKLDHPKDVTKVAKKHKKEKPKKVTSENSINVVTNGGNVPIKKADSNKKAASVENITQKGKDKSSPVKENTSKNSKNKEDSSESEADVYEVDDLIDYKQLRGKELFLVRWKGFSPDFDTWEPTANLASGLEETIETLRKKYAIKKNQVKK